MPKKFNAKRRHHIPKIKHRVRNWREYEDGLRNRGSLTFWGTPQAMRLWPAQARSTAVGQSRYSDQAIQTSCGQNIHPSQFPEQNHPVDGHWRRPRAKPANQNLSPTQRAQPQRPGYTTQAPCPATNTATAPHITGRRAPHCPAAQHARPG